MARIPKPKRQVLQQRGVVSLLRLTHPVDDGTVLFAVEYPHKAGDTEGGKMQSQFLNRAQADDEFERFATFFENRKD